MVTTAGSAYYPFGHMEFDGVVTSGASSSFASTMSSGLAAALETRAVRNTGEQQEKEHGLVPGFDQAAVTKLWSILGSGKLKNLRAFALVLQLRFGHVCNFRIRTSEPYGSLTHPKLRHSFLLANKHPGSDGSESPAIAIDPYFQQQFAIGLHDPEYSSFLTSEVPEIFVGSLSLMHSMLEVICTMMHEALGRLGVGTPPWRQPAAVMSKWFPESSHDELVGRHLALAGLVAAAPDAGPVQARGLASKGNSTSLQLLLDRNCKVQHGSKDRPKIVVVGFDLA